MIIDKQPSKKKKKMEENHSSSTTDSKGHDMEYEFKHLDATKGWTALYQLIRTQSSQCDYSIREAKKAENKNLNRYRDVSPYDHSRVKLLRGDKDYINASRLDVHEAHRAYILTQGPLPNTTGHFWQMVWEQNCKAVLMLNKVIEKNAIKCHQYWPLGSHIGNGVQMMELNAVGLRVEFVSESDLNNYTVRHLRLSDLNSEESRIILHFHYTMWPDFSVPQSPSSFLNFLFAVRQSGALDQNVGPPVVHCSAGIGRSGTFCLVDSCLVLIEKAEDLNAVDVKEMLLSMRKSRMGLIQTADQLRFSYLAIIEGAKRVLNTSSNNGDELKTNRLKRPSGAVEDEDEDSSSLSRSSSDDNSENGLPTSSGSCGSNSDSSPPVLPAKRGRYSNGNDELLFSNAFDQSSSEDTEEVVKSNDETSNGVVVTNFSEKLREAEVRKRQRKEKNEKLRDKVKDIQSKQRESEKWLKRRKSLWKPVSVSLIILLGGGYLVYRFWKGY
ncbi:hypothetical protein CHUAL_013556 [Chamberlinius hualienensis]